MLVPARFLSMRLNRSSATVRRIKGMGLRLLAPALLSAVMLSGPLATPAQAVLPTALNQEQMAMITRAEQKLTEIHNLRATFQQVSNTGGTASGMVAIKRPGRMRLDYAPPTPVQIIANGTHLIYIDTELNQVSYLGLDSTPAGILLREKVSFKDPDIAVTGVQETPDSFEINVIMRDDPGAGTLTLVFDRKSFDLTQWRSRDAQGVVTSVVLQNIERGVTLDDSLFRFVEPEKQMPRN